MSSIFDGRKQKWIFESVKQEEQFKRHFGVRKTTPLEKSGAGSCAVLPSSTSQPFIIIMRTPLPLSEEMENELLGRCMDDFEYKDCLLTDPIKFLENVPVVLEKQEQMFSILFSGRMDVLFKRFRGSSASTTPEQK